jgi:hypothetical protein
MPDLQVPNLQSKRAKKSGNFEGKCRDKISMKSDWGTGQGKNERNTPGKGLPEPSKRITNL